MRECIVVFKNVVSLHQVFVTECLSQFLEYLNIVKHTDSFLSGPPMICPTDIFFWPFLSLEMPFHARPGGGGKV